jgi:hypothetical protein
MISQTSADNSSKLLDGSIPQISTGVVSNVLNASGSTRRSDLKDSLRNITKFNKSNKSLILQNFNRAAGPSNSATSAGGVSTAAIDDFGSGKRHRSQNNRSKFID